MLGVSRIKSMFEKLPFIVDKFVESFIDSVFDSKFNI